MLVCNHTLAGAAIGLAGVSNPLLGFGLGFASHLAMDAMPHWGIDPKRANRDELFLKVARKDGCGSCALLGAILALTPASSRVGVGAAMFGAVLPDLEKPWQHFTGRRLFPQWFRTIHKNIQNESESRMPVEMGTLMVGGAVLGMALLRTRRYGRLASAA